MCACAQVLHRDLKPANPSYHPLHPPPSHHPLQVLHRDLKPANLLIDYTDVLKVSDFGLAKVRPAPRSPDAYQPFLMTGETGSYRYMAPEVLRHEAPHSLALSFPHSRALAISLPRSLALS